MTGGTTKVRTSKKYLTISVDDGHTTDLRSADLLGKFGFKATFYIPKTNPERDVMEGQQIRQISRCFDVGGHTISHVSLKRMSDAQAFAEISEGKKWLEDLVGCEVSAFCYPQGKVQRRPQLHDESELLPREPLFVGSQHASVFPLHENPVSTCAH